MNDPSNADREFLRLELLRILQRLTDRARVGSAPPAPPALAEFRQRLMGDSYTVLVAGEAKRGKSTFVNALVGRDLLPTAVDIATSEVFRIAHSEEIGYWLRFEDDSRQAISEQDLLRFGSQVAEDAGERPELRQVLRWIEVDAPIRFLPPGVQLLDSPGLGSLHARHGEITQRFVPRSDAVIYVLDSSSPLGRLDLDFLQQILSATPNIFFIQTMIDRFRRTDWQDVQRRNQELLAKHFGDRLVDTRVWPISATLLLKGAETDDSDYLQASRHDALLSALQAFLFRVSGVDRFARALALADSYQRLTQRALASRVAAISEQSREKRAAFQQAAAHRREQFDAEWGDRGAQRGRLVEAVRRHGATAKQGFAQLFQPGGDLSLEPDAKIGELTSLQAANDLGSSLAQDLVSAATVTWQQICAQAEARMHELLRPLVDQALALELAQGPDPAAIDTGAPPDSFKDDWWLRIRSAYSNTSFLVGLGSIVPGLGSVAHLAALWNVVRGSWKGADNPQVKMAQQELRKHLNIVLQRVRRYFLDVDLATGKPSLVDEYFVALERAVLDQVAQVVKRQAEQAQAETARMIEAAKLDDRQRADQLQAFQLALAEWESIGREIEVLAGRLARAHMAG